MSAGLKLKRGFDRDTLVSSVGIESPSMNGIFDRCFDCVRVRFPFVRVRARFAAQIKREVATSCVGLLQHFLLVTILSAAAEEDVLDRFSAVSTGALIAFGRSNPE